MGTKAQLTQNRSRVRRDELLAAAIELFAEGGSRSITHRAVAARAGLPPASTTYYFETIDDLIREALGAHVDQWTEDLTNLTKIEFEADVSIDDAAAFVTAVFAARGPEVAALELSIFLAAARVPELRTNAAEAMGALEALAVAMLERVGVENGVDLAASIVALIAGTALRRQSGQYSEPAEALLLSSAVRDLVAAHVLGAETVDQALAEPQSQGVTLTLGSLEFEPFDAALLAAPVAASVRTVFSLAAAAHTVAIDPDLADTAALTAEFALPAEVSANCVIILGKRAGEERPAACVVLANTRADVNGLVRRTIDVRKCSFAPQDWTVDETGMEYGGITPVGLPADWPILVDRAVTEQSWVLIGSGLRRSKLAVPGAALADLPGAQVLDALGLPTS